MRIDWGNKEQGWRVWPTDFDGDFTYQSDLPLMRVTFHRDRTRGWLEADMAEMTETDAAMALLGRKQIALENAMQNEARMLAHIRAIKRGDLSLDRIVLNDNGYQIIDLPVAQAEQVAQEASGE